MKRLAIAILGLAVLVAASATADAKSGSRGNHSQRIDVSRVPVMKSTISTRPDTGVTPRIVPSKAVKNAIERKIWCAQNNIPPGAGHGC